MKKVMKRGGERKRKRKIRNDESFNKGNLNQPVNMKMK